jgi:NTE family protein
LGWDTDNCVPGFVKNMKDKNISDEVLKCHQLPNDWIKSPELYETEIKQYMAKRCHFEEIQKNSLSIDKLNAIRSVGTNLTTLPETIVKDLMTHSSNLTEIQLRLYCPSLFNNSSNEI